MAKVGVIGAGSWGIALAKLLRTNGNEVTVWSIVEEEVAMLRREHEHIDKLPGVKLPEDVLFTTDLKEAIVGKEFLILAVPSVFTRSTAKSMAGYVTEGQIIVCVAKGIEEDTLMTISDVTEQECGCCRHVWTVPRGGGWNRTSDNRCGRSKDRKHCKKNPGSVYE